MNSTDVAARRYVAFAPLQGYTDCVYRAAHWRWAGGVDEYYAPFMRWEHGEARRKDVRDVERQRVGEVPTVPQVIVRDRDELAQLCDVLQSMGWGRVDLNMGCPFPMQVKAGRGCGLMVQMQRVEALVREMEVRREVVFSVKMRLGNASVDEGLALMELLNAMPLVHVVVHARLGQQGYRGEADWEAFGRLAEVCRHPLVYNGDVDSEATIVGLYGRFPQLKGVMLGRGLLARPWMLGGGEKATVVKAMHSEVYRAAREHLCGEAQVLSRMMAFWEYMSVEMDRKQWKAIKKSRDLRAYESAVAALRWQ